MKSHVTMEQHMCVVCGKSYDTGTILMDTRLRERFDRNTTTGMGLCPEHYKKGYITFIVCDPSKSVIKNNHTKPEDAYKTGETYLIKKEIIDKIIDIKIETPFVYVDAEGMAQIKKVLGMKE